MLYNTAYVECKIISVSLELKTVWVIEINNDIHSIDTFKNYIYQVQFQIKSHLIEYGAKCKKISFYA